MKADIAPSKLDCLGTVGKLSLKEYRWRDLADLSQSWQKMQPLADTPLKRVGLIAQEVVEVFPDGVTQGDTTADKLGHVWNLEVNTMISLLVGAVQQLTKRVEELEAR
jgi:hypothetical protein